MKSIGLTLITAVIALVLTTTPAVGQKGIGKTDGLARSGVQPDVTSLEGTVSGFKVEECPQTTGRSLEGVHLLLEDADGQTLNVHLGPEFATDHVMDQIAKGDKVSIAAFKTDELPDDQFIAQSLKLDDKTIHLRDENFRPSWAAGQGQGFNRGSRGNWASGQRSARGSRGFRSGRSSASGRSADRGYGRRACR